MRILLALALFAAACGGSKKSVQAPATPPTEDKASESDLRDQNTPDDADDESKRTADDPCDGGE